LLDDLNCLLFYGTVVQLRDHPLLVSGRLTNWPPVWVCSDNATKAVKGEVGILKDVKRHDLRGTHFFVYMEHDQTSYTGCFRFDDHALCEQLFNLLKGCCGRTIQEIGSMEVSGILPT
jgi:hypothetical protein